MADLGNQYPATPSFNAVGFKIITPTIQTETFSGKSRRVGFGVSYYAWEAKYPPITPRDFGPVIGFASQAFGSLYSFEIILPEISFSKAINQSSGATTSAAITAGTISVTLNNAGANKRVLAAGDFFKFNNHTKVYMCASDCDSNAGGTANLFFSGATVSAVPSGTALTLTAVPFTATFIESLNEFEVGYGGLTSYSIQMREVF
jgi:hypothetical protein